MMLHRRKSDNSAIRYVQRKTEPGEVCGMSLKLPQTQTRITPDSAAADRSLGKPDRPTLRASMLGNLRMIKLSKTGAAAILMMAVTLAPATASEQTRKEAEPVKTVAVAASTMNVVHRSTTVADVAQRNPSDSNGWGMLAAGLCIGLLIISRRRHG